MNKINIFIIIIIFLILILLFNKYTIYENFKNLETRNLSNLFTKKKQLTIKEINIINSKAIIKRNVKIRKSGIHNNLVISAIYCNENDYIEEWLDYHLKLKEIGHIYLYSNCRDNSYNKIVKYINSGKITWIDFSHIKKQGVGKIYRKPQYFSLIHNYNNFKNEYNYILHIDIDEFLHIKNMGTNNLIKYLNKNKHIGNFRISRYDFSGDNKINKQKNVINSYFYREKNPSSFKSIGRVSDITLKKNQNSKNKNTIIDGFTEDNYIASCHEFFTNKLSRTIPSNICKINHYKLKSLDEFKKRIPNSTGGRKSTKSQWDELNKKLHQVKDTEIIDF